MMSLSFYMLVSHLYIFFGEIAIEVPFLFFSSQFICRFCCWVIRVLYILDARALLYMWFKYTFSFSVSCLFAFLIVSFNAKHVFTLIKSNLSLFSFVIVFKDPLLNPKLGRRTRGLLMAFLSLCFLSNSVCIFQRRDRWYWSRKLTGSNVMSKNCPKIRLSHQCCVQGEHMPNSLCHWPLWTFFFF